MPVEFDHVAILVNDITAAVQSLQDYNWPTGNIEEFPTEGTKEVYIGPPAASGKLLLLEAHGEGPYQNALAKRGPGIHHIAVKVEEMFAFTAQLAGSGWYLHPKSLLTFEEHSTVWLARPGVPLLVEVVQGKPVTSSKIVEFVTLVEVPLPAPKPDLATVIGINQFRSCTEPNVYITIGGKRQKLAELLDLGNR